MHVLVCTLRLRLPENGSLKGKRRIISSLTNRIRNKFNVSVSEVGNTESWQTAILGISLVSNEVAYIEEMGDTVLRFVEGSRGDFEVFEVTKETFSGL